MAEILNLRKARKAKARNEEAMKASENRLKFGQAKQEGDRLRAEKIISDRQFKGHRREARDETAES